MIHYNMRYRGPYEYEKFVLNVLQYSNIAHDFTSEIDSIKEYQTLKEIEATVTDLFNKITAEDGLSEQVYKRLIMFKEAK